MKKIVALSCACSLGFPWAVMAQGPELLSPTRPGVSESAALLRPGVLQVETGIDLGFRASDYRRQRSLPLGLNYALTRHLRIDFEADATVEQHLHGGGRATGRGDTRLGFKAIGAGEPEQGLAFALAYQLKLPTADADEGLGSGRTDHELRLVANRVLGKNDFRVNVSYLNVGRAMSPARDDGGQFLVGMERGLAGDFSATFEVYRNSVDAAQPRGTYALAALAVKLRPWLQFDIGLSAGRGRDAPDTGVFAGLSVGVPMARAAHSP
ncbi:MAG: transporter [Methylibium sp.]|uniref:transporter n=1 Tax=Methylibium sp. TaxID=2067992 RepID=UPI00184DA68A|nr:transporter [Methylibium sp.]MBA2722056.1 transporter [Methylibium sp.]MBA3589760.1 transporter [Methylibium sp.]